MGLPLCVDDDDDDDEDDDDELALCDVVVEVTVDIGVSAGIEVLKRE